MRQERQSSTSHFRNSDLSISKAQSLTSLLEALACHAINYDYDERTAFQREIRETSDKFENAVDSEAIVALTAESVNLVRGQSQEVERFIKGIATEKQVVIHLITESLIKVCTRSESTAQSLRALEKELEKASQLRDVRSLQTKIAHALDAICQEAAGQEEQLKELQPALLGLAKKTASVDEITGLPGLSEAEAAIKELAKTGASAYVVAMTVRNLDVVNRRMGFVAGNELLVAFSQEIAQRLSGKDQLFRWRGPSFVAVFARGNSLEAVKREAAKFGAIRQERTIEDENSSIFFKMSTAWHLFPIPRASELAGFSDQIDAFLLGQAPRDTSF
jgi:GGDEF domain-containing protein